MKSNEPTLGWALAHLQAEQTIEHPPMSATDKNYLEPMIRRFEFLKADGRLSSVLKTVPAQSCLYNHPFLENNEDFYIALFSNTKQEETCIKLYQHLNDCYHCFEIFSQVLRDYYYCGEELSDFYEEKDNG
jgi:hypothetical protein